MGALEQLCEKIYPLTIIIDRYSGAYSGGPYTAWNCGADEVPCGISGDDGLCFDTWLDLREREHADHKPYFGVGPTVYEAVRCLYSKLNKTNL